MKTLARDWVFEVAPIDTTAPIAYVSADYKKIGGITEWGLERGEETADGSDFDLAGWAADIVVARNGSFSLTAHEKYTGSGETAVRDVGQADLVTASLGIGEDAMRHFRAYNIRTKKGFECDVSVTGGNQGGGINDLTSYEVGFAAQGVISQITVTP